MTCRFCHKRLKIFASERYPFCSEEHERVYLEEQSRIAMQRLSETLTALDQPGAPEPVEDGKTRAD